MLLQAHSGFRYLVLLAGVAVVAYALFGMATARAYDKPMRVLSAAFAGLLDLTILLGVAALFTGMRGPHLGGHIASMIAAALVAHVVHAVMKRRPPEQRTWAPHAVGAAVALGLIAVGILSIGRPLVG